jgi:hypothetical protein
MVGTKANLGMSISTRSFQQCVDDLQASRPEKKLLEQEPPNYDSIKAYAFGNLAEWPRNPPITSLHLQGDPLNHCSGVLSDPASLLDYLNCGNAVGIWNARGRATWQHENDQWIIADVDLGGGQGEDDGFDDEGAVSVVFALWKVEEGYAAAIWRPDERAVLARVMGLETWPESGWQNAEVWYGE